MKKALLLALAGLFSAVAPALAYPPVPANVNFTSERGVPFGLVLDGQPMTRGLTRQVHMEQLMPGQHWADFTLPAAYGRAVRFRSRVWLEPGLETTFVLVSRPGWPISLQQAGAVSLYGPGRGYGQGYYNGGPRYNSPVPYGQGGYDANAPYGGGYDPNYNAAPSPPAPNGGYNGNGGYNNGGYGNNPAGPNGTYGTPPNSPNGTYGTNPNGPSGNYPPNPNTANTPNGGGYYPNPAASNYRALAPQDLNALVQTVQQRISEVSKLNAAKDGLNQRSLRADDLSRLLRTLSSESCRIELAKFAYTHVSDPENFNRVYDAFETEDGARAVEQAVNDGSLR
ncbi:DUF4476 domain-containing protein [Hymenobacter rubidus]|uniref:DUF4476 domain-containing protein n=1 Tax=Hymenobacter rubidus TaxID=1441626 RepID=UPI00191DC267|nr:DUF4476 domain-containing protein [Hymenobacter rubidus]